MTKAETFIKEAQEGNLEYVKIHLDTLKDSAFGVHCQNIIKAFIFSPSIEICDYFLKQGININEIYKKNYESNMYEFSWTSITALIYAIQNNYTSKIQWLIDNKADVNIPITEVYGEYHDDPYEPLIKYHRESPLMLAVDKANIDLIHILLKVGANVNYKDVSHNTALKIAQNKEYTEIVELLKQAGAKENKSFYQIKRRELNEPDTFGETPLLKAVKKGQPEEVKNLITQGADVNASVLGQTPLKNAILGDKLEIVRLLLQHGANITKYELTLAKNHKNSEIIKLLETPVKPAAEISTEKYFVDDEGVDSKIFPN